MASKNAIKIYLDGGYYHIYNRGVEKRDIFLDQQDYGVFLSYLKDYLLPKDEEELRSQLTDPEIGYRERDKILKLIRLNNFFEEITLMAYCLMPNHFHFFIKQRSSQSIDKFMQSLFTRYTMYFNRKYKRVGSLFQAVYKAALVENEEQFLHLSRYIHKQALALQGESWEAMQPSSYNDYLGKRQTPWVHPEEILSYFSKGNPSLTYQNFIEENDEEEILVGPLLDNDY